MNLIEIRSTMSLIDDVLILADNVNEFGVDQAVNNTGCKKQIVASTLGRLTSKGLLKKKVANKQSQYSITNFGRQRINSILENIKLYNFKSSTNSSWQIVIFDIPEKIRSTRDTFRNSLIKFGFGKLQDSIWVSYHNQTSLLDELLDSLKIQDRVNIIFTSKISVADEKLLINKINWDWTDINSQYKIFIAEASKFLANKNKDSFNAKRLVFNFAKSMQKDPKLPGNLQPKNALTQKAYSIYLKIRPYCYS